MLKHTKIKIAIASGKGGTGKTFISTNLFSTLQQQQKEVILVDCDAEEPNDLQFITGQKYHSTTVNQLIPVIDKEKCSFCGKCFDYCNYNAIFFLKDRKYIEILEDQCHGCGACSVTCTDGAISEKEDELGTVDRYTVEKQTTLVEARMKVGVHSPVSTIKAAIKSAEAEIVILDSPPGTSCPFIQTAAKADMVVLVTEPTPFGLSDLKQAVDTLKSMGKCYAVIVNKAGLGSDDVYHYLKAERIPLLMSVPFDKTIALQYSNGKLVVENNDKWLSIFANLYQNIIQTYGDCSN